MSLIGYSTKKDISNWRGFLMMGLIGVDYRLGRERVPGQLWDELVDLDHRRFLVPGA